MRLWDIDEPNLYELTAALEPEGGTTDAYTIQF
ncbi:MAG: hypothetical protein R2912_01040 [Eubacteriales bacterium]